MPIVQMLSSRAALASAALLSLAVLAGCESTSAGSAHTDVAGTSPEPIRDPASVWPPFGTQLVNTRDRVHFALDRYDLSPDAEATLQKQAALLQQYPEVAIAIEGHAEERGTREYNLALGERRADAVRNYLTVLGVNPARITVISFGKERPECVAADESCWSQNRRGVTVASQ